MKMPRRKKNGTDQPQPIDGGTDAPQEQSNSAARADTIRAAARWLSDREAEVKSLRQEIAEYKAKHIKGDLGFKLSDWNTLYRLYGLEGDDRDKLIDTIREGFEALGIGEQGSFMDAMDPQPRASKPNGNGTAAPNLVAREAGRTDGLAGERTHEADWPQGEYGAADYEMGYDDGVEQRARANSTF
jgi:hypothetical protein